MLHQCVTAVCYISVLLQYVTAVCYSRQLQIGEIFASQMLYTPWLSLPGQAYSAPTSRHLMGQATGHCALPIYGLASCLDVPRGQEALYDHGLYFRERPW